RWFPVAPRSPSRRCHRLSPSIGWSAHSSGVIRKSGRSGGGKECQSRKGVLESCPQNRERPAPPAVLPDRRAMESFLAAITGRRGDEATAKAQDVMYEAWERTTSRSRIALAHKALGISPLCADAYVLLAEEARSI